MHMPRVLMMAPLRALALLGALAGGAGCHRSPPRPTTAVVPLRPPRVVFGRTVRVFFEGNHVVPTEDLRAVTTVDKAPENGEAEHADDVGELVSRDLLWVTAVYYDRGYVLVQTDPPRVAEATDGPFVDVTFRIVKEGPRIRLGRTDVYERDENGQVTEPLGGEPLRRFISLRSGSWFARDVLVRDLHALRRFYRDRGYANVEAEPETELDLVNAKMDFVVPVRRGALVHIERIELVAPDDVVPTMRRELLLAEGDLFHETKLEDSRHRMEVAAHLRHVELSSKRGSDDAHIVITFEASRSP